MNERAVIEVFDKTNVYEPGIEGLTPVAKIEVNVTTPEVADFYWDAVGPAYVQRGRVLAMLREVAPFDSVLEVGSAGGPNFREILAAWPGVRCTGLEPDPFHLAVGRERLPQAAFVQGRAPEDMGQFEDASHDVVLLCGVVTVIGSGLAEALRHAQRVARRAVVAYLETESDLWPSKVVDGLQPWAPEQRPEAWGPTGYLFRRPGAAA